MTEVITTRSAESQLDGHNDVPPGHLGDHALAGARHGLVSGAPTSVPFDPTRGRKSNAAMLFDPTRGRGSNAALLFDPTRGRDIEASPLEVEMARWTRTRELSAATG